MSLLAALDGFGRVVYLQAAGNFILCEIGNTMRLPATLVKDILLKADFSVEKLMQMRQEHSFFADMLSDNSFWVPHSPHGLAARHPAPKTLLPALQRRQAACHALRGQMHGQSRHRDPFGDEAAAHYRKVVYVNFDAMLAAARRPNFEFLQNLTDEVLGDELSAFARYRARGVLMRDMTFASAAVRNVNVWFLDHVMREARTSRLKRRQYRRLCELAVARDPWLILSPWFTAHRGAPAHQDRALAEQAVSAEPRIFSRLSPPMRRQTKFIKILEAKGGLKANHLNGGDTFDPAYVRRLFDAQLFKDDPYFMTCLIRKQVAPPAYLYGRLDGFQLLDAMRQDAYRTDRILIREAVFKNGIYGWMRGANFALYPNDDIGPRQIVNVTFLDMLVTEPEFSGIVGQGLYDLYARPYGLKTTALEKNYMEWRTNMAWLGLAALLALYLDPYAHALIWPPLWGTLLVYQLKSMWPLGDLLKPPW